jgi:hypothetical protein
VSSCVCVSPFDILQYLNVALHLVIRVRHGLVAGEKSLF